MGLTDLLSDLWEAVSFTELHAEEPQQQQEDNEQENSEEGGDEEKEKGEEGGEDKEEDSEGGEEEEDGDDEGGDEEEEEEEEEPEDPKPKLEEDCAHSAQCAPMKHHYDACVARVTDQENNPDAHHGKKEDCVEEFFHLQHCAAQCAAPKLFKMLK